MPPLITWLVRHGQSTANAGITSVDNEKVTLTELGFQQSAELALRLVNEPNLLIVSPFLRTQLTAEAIRCKWPTVPYEIWPIHEFSYLDAEKCKNTSVMTRRPWVESYWQRGDPEYVDGPGAESFESFMRRLSVFDERLMAMSCDFVVVVGHGQFIRAYLECRKSGFTSSPQVMNHFRSNEMLHPVANTEVIELLSGEQL